MTRWRAASLITVHLLIAIHFLHWKLFGRTLAPVEPSEMFDTLHLGVITVGFLFMAGLVLATSIAGRFFCSWGCHILALQDLCAWILKTLRIPTKPVRSRALLWVPPLAVLYLFVWPQLKRLIEGESLPALHVVSDAGGWTSFTTSDLLRSFPGPGTTLLTFAICGFVLVYFLGSRSFCSYACPYGAIFAAAERVAPFRIIAGPGECSQCGLCISSCKSSVRVIEEVRQFGAVMDSNCMKDLDCISVCPTDALRYAATKPPLFRSWRGPRGLAKPYDFSLGEDLLMAGVFIAVLPVIRGLYDAISFLLALAICTLLAYFTVVTVRLLRRERVTVSNLVLKTGGRFTAPGRLIAASAALLAVFVFHSGFVRYHILAGELALSSVAPPAKPGENGQDWNEGLQGAISSQSAMTSALATALHHFEQASRWGLVRPRGLTQQLAVLYLRTGSLTNARNQLHSLLANNADDQESRLLLAQAWLLDGRPELAKQQLEQVVKSASSRRSRFEPSGRDRQLLASAHCLLADVETRSGDRAEALHQFDLAIEIDPRNADAHMGRGALLAAAGQLEDAAASLKSSVELDPDSAAAHNNLAAVLVRLDRPEEALEHYQRSLALMPNNPLASCNVGLLLAKANRLDEAEQAFVSALDQQPDYAPALKGLAEIRRRLAHTGQPMSVPAADSRRIEKP
jgi:tetratricopeptide (TPR) repeat protein/ferredoxin